MINSVPGGQAISTIYWYAQLRRYSVQRSVAAFALLVSSLVGIATLVLLTAGGLAAGSHGFGSQARFPVLAVAAAIVIAAVLGRRRLVPAALWAVRHLSGPDAPPEQPVGANHLVLLLALGFLNWLFDAAVLFASLAAMGQPILMLVVIPDERTQDLGPELPEDVRPGLASLDEEVDHARGPTAGRLILEYGDYECPCSRQAFRAIEHVEQELSRRVRFAFRH